LSIEPCFSSLETLADVASDQIKMSTTSTVTTAQNFSMQTQTPRWVSR
jgi:hypothetical protein